MKYVDEYRDLKLTKRILRRIYTLLEADKRDYNFMEVCGTHTNTFFRFGLRSLLPQNLRLISGPGCPVCVTATSYIDNAIALAKMEGVIITTFGDMMKVPGSYSSLYDEKAKGRDVRIVYSSLDALNVAEDNLLRNVIFLAVGFETTAPTVGMAILEAKKRGIKNFFIYSAHKLIPPALECLVSDPDIHIGGFILPAHVSAIIGANAYKFLKRFKIPCVIAGFEPLDMLQGIMMLLEQLKSDRPKIEIQYTRVVKKEGNKKAQRILKKVFSVTDAMWRGLGSIPQSGLKLRRGYSSFDAERHFRIKDSISLSKADKYCLCGEILKGKNVPKDCKLFGKACTPENPKGPCMVSSEGSCSIFYKYKTYVKVESREKRVERRE